jgi:RND family efflux transporter MFP subunit
MRRSEAGWLIAGLLVGGILAASAFIGRQYVLSRRGPVVEVTPSAPPAPPAAATEGAEMAVQLTDEEQRSIGVETAEVKRQTIRREITAPGKIAEPETGIGAISARIGGRIEKLLLNVTGESVARGQAVAVIYSPEVFTAAEEYKLALENRQRLSASREPQAITNADELVRASRRRLELWGLTSQQIDEIASSSAPSVQVTIYSSMSGVVTKRNIAEGQYVKEGDVLYTVTDLSTVWVQADIFETDIPVIRTGQSVKITAPALGGSSVRGAISFLQPAVDPQTRTIPVRIQVPNPEMRLRPGMFVQVSLEAPVGSNVVAVPRSAVLETGQDKVVYVAKGNGVFEKRSIEASTAGDEYYAVSKGVEPGERVVTHGNFLIDSQTRLTGNITGMFGGSKAFEASAPQTPGANYTVSLRSEPSPLRGGSDGLFHATVNDPQGKPVTDAQVQVTLVMPAMPAMGMGEMRSSSNLAWNGSEYAGPVPIAMAGPWNVTVEARRGGQLLGVYRTRFDAK